MPCARLVAAGVFLVAAAGWSRISTMTGVFASWESAAASSVVNGCWAAAVSTGWAAAAVACVMANVAVAVTATANASLLLRRMGPSGSAAG